MRIALTAHDASTHLTESDETMAVETRGGAEAYLETLGEVLGLGCQWADFAYRNATLALPVEGGKQLLLQRDIQDGLALVVVQLSSL